jgi:hypothetical protein
MNKIAKNIEINMNTFSMPIVNKFSYLQELMN